MKENWFNFNVVCWLHTFEDQWPLATDRNSVSQTPGTKNRITLSCNPDQINFVRGEILNQPLADGISIIKTNNITHNEGICGKSTLNLITLLASAALIYYHSDDFFWIFPEIIDRIIYVNIKNNNKNGQSKCQHRPGRSSSNQLARHWLGSHTSYRNERRSYVRLCKRLRYHTAGWMEKGLATHHISACSFSSCTQTNQSMFVLEHSIYVGLKYDFNCFFFSRHFARQISLREDSAEKTWRLQQPVAWYNWFSILTDLSRGYEPQPSGMLKFNHYVFQHPDVRRLGLICPPFPRKSLIDGAISHPADFCRNHGGLFAARYKNNKAKIATKTLLINKNTFAQHTPKQNSRWHFV